MRDDRHSGITTTGQLGGQKVALAIDPAAMAHIMGVLTDLYSDPELAVIREYATNAWDSHVEAGQSRPIEVELPTPMRTFLTIRDFGIGLDRDDIVDTYSQYGKSTKTDTNAQVGMLGLGCKSALTYAPQFTVTGVKDGRRVQVAVGRDDDGAGSMTVLSDTETDAPNGVEVTVPARERNEIEEKAREFFSVWPEGSVLINGEPPERIDGLWLSDDLCVTDSKGSGRNDDVVVMGGVSYPVPTGDLTVGTQYGHRLVAFVDIGDVHFTPSREALADTEKTKARLTKIETDFAEAAHGKAQTDVDAADTPWEALGVALQWKASITGIEGLTYRGEALPEVYGPDTNTNAWGLEKVWVATTAEAPQYHGRARPTYTRGHRDVPAKQWPVTLFVNGFEPQRMSPSHRAKALKLAEERGLEGYKQIAASCYPVPTAWLKPEQVIAWDDLAAVQLPRAERTGGGGEPRPRGSYYGYTPEDWYYSRSITADQLDAVTGTIYWMTGGKRDNNGSASRLDDVAGKGWVLVNVPRRRQAKFLKDFPNAVHLDRAAWQAMHDRWWARVGDRSRRAIALSTAANRSLLKALNPDKVTDPDLAEAARLARHDVTDLQEKRSRFASACYVATLPEVADPLEAYPLLSTTALGIHPDATYRYLKAEHEHRTVTSYLKTGELPA